MMTTALRDGLYRVVTDSFCAGFVVQGGQVIRCAPILARYLPRWMRVAEYVGA